MLVVYNANYLILFMVSDFAQKSVLREVLLSSFFANREKGSYETLVCSTMKSVYIWPRIFLKNMGFIYTRSYIKSRSSILEFFAFILNIPFKNW